MLRESITVKLDYREQLSISDKIINLIFVYFFFILYLLLQPSHITFKLVVRLRRLIKLQRRLLNERIHI